jgi:hypothetical protein
VKDTADLQNFINNFLRNRSINFGHLQQCIGIGWIKKKCWIQEQLYVFIETNIITKKSFSKCIRNCCFHLDFSFTWTITIAGTVTKILPPAPTKYSWVILLTLQIFQICYVVLFFFHQICCTVMAQRAYYFKTGFTMYCRLICPWKWVKRYR